MSGSSAMFSDLANHTTGSTLQAQIRSFQGWLHIGTIVCPPCHEICGENDNNCQPDTTVKSYYAAPDKQFYFDELPCGGNSIAPNWTTFLLLTLLLFLLGS
ncbi:hypothetical protein JTE90_022318 [Oedothorax gibbosus]|uniref:Uncharacterized protein n=1 Tax=Oedothorax gibbosus TaxID=931172 RepID=A0AAV6VXZ7_9ARAC|nr:hypothetical protein JTE90_022318 [Oedothorax gibbosus]